MSSAVRLVLSTGILGLLVFGKVPVGFKSIQHCKDYLKQKYESPSNTITFPTEQPTAIKYPFVVSIYKNEENPSILCGGILIDKRYVLTAAHCMKGDLSATFIRAGSETGGGERYNIRTSIIHPQISTTMHYHDIGLIELEEDVKFSNNVQPICLQVSKNIPHDYWMSILWSVSENETYNLITYSTKEIKSDGCQEDFTATITPLGVVDNLQICFREDREEREIRPEGHAALVRKDASSQQFVAIGIPSIGSAIAGSPPKISTRISSYISWIESIVWPEKPMKGCSKVNFQM